MTKTMKKWRVHVKAETSGMRKVVEVRAPSDVDAVYKVLALHFDDPRYDVKEDWSFEAEVAT